MIRSFEGNWNEDIIYKNMNQSIVGKTKYKFEISILEILQKDHGDPGRRMFSI